MFKEDIIEETILPKQMIGIGCWYEFYCIVKIESIEQAKPFKLTL